MKIFIYKTLFVFFLIFVLFQVTIGWQLRQIDEKINYFKSKDNIETIKNKIRGELRSAIGKDQYLKEEDAKLIKDFLEKITTELNQK